MMDGWLAAQLVLAGRKGRRLLAALLVFSASLAAAPPQETLPVLTRVEDIRLLSPEKAERGYPVRFRGVVTYYGGTGWELFVQDATGGVYIHTKADEVLPLEAGSWVEVEGTTTPGYFAPMIVEPRFRILGRGKHPTPHRTTLAELSAGALDSQWVEIEGVVRQARIDTGHLSVHLSTAGGRVEVRIPGYWDKPAPANLVDARVRVRGAVGTMFNERRQLVGVRLFAPDLTFLSILSSAPADPFNVPVRPISRVLEFTPEQAVGHRVKIRGVVTLHRLGRSLFVQGPTGSIYVESSQGTPLDIGDEVEVLGFPAPGARSPYLQDAIFRKVGRAPAAEPQPAMAAAALNGELDGELVRIEGVLLDKTLVPEEQVLILESDGVVFQTKLEDAGSIPVLRKIEEGSRLAVTGICSVQVDENRTPRAFRVLARSVEDIRVIERTPWWTHRHAVLLLLIIGGILLLAAVAVAILRRQVRDKTAEIREWLRRQAALAEQYQNLFENATDAVFTCNLEGKITSLNRAGERLTGYSRVEIQAKSLFALMPPEQEVEGWKSFARVLSGEELGISEWTLLTKDGRRLEVELTGNAIRENDRVVGIQGIARDITERKRAEAERERLLRQLHERVKEQTALHRAARLLQSTQQSVEEVISKVAALLPAAWQYPEIAEARVVFDGAESRTPGFGDSPWKQRAEFATSDGRQGVIEVVYREERPEADEGPFLVEERDLLSAVAEMLRAFLDRKAMEEALQRSEQRYRTLFENAPVGIYRTTPDGQILAANPALMRMMGYESYEQLSRRNLEHEGFEPSYPRAAFKEQIERQGEVRGLETSWRRKDGAVIHIRENATAVRDAEGNTLYYEGTVEDITERRRAEEQIRFQASLLDQVRSAVIATDLEGRIVYWNRFAESLYQWKAEEALGRRIVEVTVPAFARAMATQIVEDIRARNQWEGEFMVQRKDGTVFPAYVIDAIVRDSQGRDIGFVGVSNDITERKRMQEELERAKEAAEAASRAKSEFVARVSHEIRTPMNGIIGMAELALETPLSSEQREYLELVRSSAESLLAIINEILDFSKIESGRLTLEEIEFNLPSAVGETLKAFAPRAHQKGLELAWYVAPDVPESVAGDPVRLRQILTNLLGNAIKFTDRGEVTLRVELASGRELRFSVADTGIGIAPEKQRAIFEAFTQADGSTTRRYGGTGLGLAIASRMAELMGGRLEVESEPGRGSVFHFTVPFGVPAEVPAAASPAGFENLRGLRALIVDDHPTNRRFLSETLARWGMHSVVAEDGPAALRLWKQAEDAGEPFHLLLVDSEMPEMDGFALLEHLRSGRNRQITAILLLTSSRLREEAERCRKLGAATYLVKPLTPRELLDTVLRVLGKVSPREKSVPAAQRAPVAPRRGMRLLVAEDNPVNQKLVRRVLERHGHEVCVVGNGREAVEAVRQQQFDAVLMDIEMPEMDGFEALAALRAAEFGSGARLPVIAMTAHAMLGDRERCLAAGFNSYVPKPLDPRALLRAMEEFRGRAPEIASSLAAAPAFDLAQALERVEGDEKLLREMAELFLDGCEKLMSDAREALRLGDAHQLERAAHTLKSSVGNFAALAARKAAEDLESLARQGDLARVEPAWNRLEDELQRLQRALADLGEEARA
jgi:PAS domain S-box-containing protein